MAIKYIRGRKIKHETDVGQLTVRNTSHKVEVLYEYDEHQQKYRLFTDEVKYGKHLEVIFSNEKQCFVIKDFYKLKERWYKTHGKSVKDVDDTIKNFLGEF